MSRRLRRAFTPEFKAKVVLDVLTGTASQAEACRKHQISPSLFALWKATFLQRLPVLFQADEQHSSEAARVTQLMALHRSRRSQASSTGRLPLGARVRRTVGVRKNPDSSRNARYADRCQASRTIRGNSSPAHLATSLSLRSLAFRRGFWLVHPSRRLRILRTCSGW